jgi:DNA-directed RNA polymerase subunit RPC12/RpoP
MELKQYCPYCSGKIAYPSEMAGSSTVCPHCQREVELDREIKQECRACGEKVGFPESLLGESVACPHCGESMKLHRSAADAFKQASANRGTGTSVQYFLHMGGNVEGPLIEAEVCGLIEQGNIRQDTMVRIGDANGWFPLGQLSQFAASIQKQTTAPAQEEAPTDDGPAEIMLMVKGQQYGPYTFGQIRQRLEAGTMDSHTSANRPGMPGWTELRTWGEFQEVSRQIYLAKEAAEIEAQKLSRNPHAIDCFGSGILLPTILFMPVLVGDLAGGMILSWVLFLGWFFGKPLLFKVPLDLGEEFGHRGTFEFAFRVYFCTLWIWSGFLLFRIIFARGDGDLQFVYWTLQLPFLYLTWNGFRGLKRYFSEYEQSSIDLALVIIGAIPLVLVQLTQSIVYWTIVLLFGERPN